MSNRGGQYSDNPRLEMLALVPAGARSVLDVGCFRGAFGHALKRLRPEIEVWGVEPDRNAAEHASRRIDRVLVGKFPDAMPDRLFDCVFFNDALEHMVDPWSALRSAVPLLTPSGRIVASIPNVRHFSVLAPLLIHGRFAYRDSGILDRTHLRFFAKADMIDLFAAAGLRVASITPIALSPSRPGKIPLALALLGRAASEFRAYAYIIVASPDHRTEAAVSDPERSRP